MKETEDGYLEVFTGATGADEEDAREAGDSEEDALAIEVVADEGHASSGESALIRHLLPPRALAALLHDQRRPASCSQGARVFSLLRTC